MYVHAIRTHLLLTPPYDRFCNTEHQKMASKKNARLGSVRHKDVCGLLKTWCGVARGSVTAENCQEVCGSVCICVCVDMHALSLSRRYRHMLKCAHTQIRTLTLSHTH